MVVPTFVSRISTFRLGTLRQNLKDNKRFALSSTQYGKQRVTRYQTSSTDPMASQDVLTSSMKALERTMLSVGSGDGSQQKAIVERGLRNLQVTFYDCKERLLQKYPHAQSILAYLEQNCTHAPKYQFDATQIHELYHPNSFDLVFFTFPHTEMSNNDPLNIETHQTLLKDFLNSASQVLKPQGQIQITLGNGSHYQQWRLPALLKESMKLQLLSVKEFDPSEYPGYKHRLTKGMAGNLKVVPDKHGAKVYIFSPDQSRCQSDESPPLPARLEIWVPPPVQSPPPPPPPRVAWTDIEVQERLVQRLDAAPRDVLELRRTFAEPLPETRQMNRILYAMDRIGLAQRHDAKAQGKKKPRWSSCVPP